MQNNKQRERLAGLIDDFCKKELGTNFNTNILEMFARHILADGWMRPPCKVGDTVYTAFHPYKGNELRKPLEGRCITVGAYEFGNIVRVMFDTRKVNGCRDYRFTDFGKTVFLTKEEAEAKLKGGEGK